MKKLICSILCATVLLSLAGCKKEPSSATGDSPESTIPDDLKTYISDAATNSARQTSFHMNGSYYCDGVETQYDLYANEFGTEQMNSGGSIDKNGIVEIFNVTGTTFHCQKADAEGQIQGYTEVLTDVYTQCETLAMCKYIRSLPGNDSILSAIDSNGTLKNSKGINIITASLSNEQLVSVYPEELKNENISNAAIEISVNKDGFCSRISLSYHIENRSCKYDFQFNQYGVQQSLDSVTVKAVSSDTWNKAFSPSSFENVTITRYYDDRTKENPSILMINGACSSKNLNQSSIASDGSVTKIEGMTYFYQYGAQFFQLEHGTFTDSKGNKTPHYKLMPTEHFKGETSGSFASSLNASFSFSGHYDDYTYDAESGSYTGISSDDKWTYTYCLSFANGHIASIHCSQKNNETDEIQTIHSYYFTDYGNTEIAIPTK